MPYLKCIIGGMAWRSENAIESSEEPGQWRSLEGDKRRRFSPGKGWEGVPVPGDRGVNRSFWEGKPRPTQFFG
jgi:hypothetical protein